MAKAEPKAKAKAEPAPQGKIDIEVAADKARKAKVDAANAKAASVAAEKEAALADTPLTEEEERFVADVAARMNEGRAVMQPSPAEITRYSQLLKRKAATG